MRSAVHRSGRAPTRSVAERPVTRLHLDWSTAAVSDSLRPETGAKADCAIQARLSPSDGPTGLLVGSRRYRSGDCQWRGRLDPLVRPARTALSITRTRGFGHEPFSRFDAMAAPLTPSAFGLSALPRVYELTDETFKAEEDDCAVLAAVSTCSTWRGSLVQRSRRKGVGTVFSLQGESRSLTWGVHHRVGSKPLAENLPH